MKRFTVILLALVLCGCLEGCVSLDKHLARETLATFTNTVKPLMEDALADGVLNGRKLLVGEAEGIRADIAKTTDKLTKAAGE